MSAIDRMANRLDILIKSVSALMVMLMCIIVLLQVWLRYVVKGSLPWSEEAARYLMIWLSFLGASTAFRQKRHIGMTVLINLIPERARRVIWLCTNILMALLLLFIAYQGFTLLPGVAPEKTPALQISLAWAYLAIPVGMVLCFIQVMAGAIKDFLVTGKNAGRSIGQSNEGSCRTC